MTHCWAIKHNQSMIAHANSQKQGTRERGCILFLKNIKLMAFLKLFIKLGLEKE